MPANHSNRSDDMNAAADGLNGLNVIITGASSGIGAAAARLFAADGARVVLVARREKLLNQLADEIEQAGGQAAAFAGDVTVPGAMADAVAFAVDRFGGLDAAFNNAGYATTGTPLHLIEDGEYDTIMDVNLRGVWNCMRHQIPAMLASGRGSIVNTSSVAGVVATAASAPYIAAKHAVLGLTRAAAAEYGARHIRVNALVVGNTMTDMIRDVLDERPELEQGFLAKGIQHRFADPVEVARAARWLVGAGSSFVTGAAIAVDGGRTAI